ncbi:MAG: extracellular solute-binding protein [Bauldia sp.]
MGGERLGKEARDGQPLRLTRRAGLLGGAAGFVAGSLGLFGRVDRAFAAPSHGIAMYGDPAQPANFTSFAYANPNAPKGGTLTYGVIGTFDSMNPFIVRGAATTSRGLYDPIFGDNVHERIMARSRDEAFTLYGLIAESIETPADRSWVEFTFNRNARWADGAPLTAADFKFTIELLADKGRPVYKTYRDRMAGIDLVGERGIRITFNKLADRETPLLMGLMPILPKHAINVDTFDQSTLKPLLGNGPYMVEEVQAPSRMVLKRNPNYWGKDLPVKRGLDNFDRIVIDYYRDTTTMFEAFKRGLYDINPDTDPASWLGNYDFPAVNEGKVIKATFPTQTPKGMQGFVMNTRRPVFADIRVRRAMAMLFDFEWINANLYRGVYKRSASFFEDSELSSRGRPAGDREKALLAPFANAVAPEVMAGTYQPAKTDGSGNDRAALRAAVDVLTSAGYEARNGQMVNKANGQQLTFEFLALTKDAERLALAYNTTLERVGIKMNVRLIDSAQYERRIQAFDFDMFLTAYGASLSPGVEQINRWGSDQASTDGSQNYAGAKEPAIDAMIKAMTASTSKEDFVSAVRALDRVLVSQHYVVPLYFLPDQWVAHWSRIKRPAATSVYGYTFPTWWAEPA